MTASRWYRRAAIITVLVVSIAGCTTPAQPGSPALATATDFTATVPPAPTAVATPIRTPTMAVLSLSEFAFPSEIDPDHRFMFYLHGKIIEDQGLPAISPEYGEYQYKEILWALQSYGFVVISEQRPRNADTTEYARRVVGQINDLIGSQVPAGSITVVGASKGAAVAMLVSNLLADFEVNYVLLGARNPPAVDELMLQGVSLYGNVLAIYDSSDEYAGSCERLFSYSEGNGLAHRSELVVRVGTGHGMLYKPLSEWVVPTVMWANHEW